MPRRASAVAELGDVVQDINRRWPGILRKASDPEFQIERLPTGILSLDILLDGGFARGRHVEIFGGYNVGKTWTTYKFIATCQAAGHRCAFLDVEGTFDPDFAASAGVNLETLTFPEHGHHANRLINIMEVLLRSGEYDVIVLDSIAALLPQAEQEKDMEESTMGTHQARLMSAALRRLTTANKRTVLVYINQTREAIGVTFGKRSITSGGKAMGFYAGLRLEMVRTETLKRKAKVIDHAKGDEKQTDVAAGHRVLVRVEKDKTGGARPTAETTFVFSYDLGGVDPVEDLLYLGRVYGLVHKRATSWWVEGYEEEKQVSRARFVRWLRLNVAVAQELEERIREVASATRRAESQEADVDDEE